MSPRALIFVFGALSMVGALSTDAYLPALPAIAAHFGVHLAVAQQSLTIFLIASATMIIFHGTLSDSFGRRPVMLGALWLYLTATVGAGCSDTLGWLLFFRLLQGLCAGAGTVIGRAMINDLFPPREAQRMSSYVFMVFALAPAFAPILGGWLQAGFGWRAIFFCIAFFTAVLLTVCQLFLPESLPRTQRHAFHPKIIVSNYWRVAKHGQFMFQALAGALASSVLILYISSAPAFVINILHLKVTDFAWLFFPMIGGLTLGSLTSGRLSHALPSSTLIHAGFTILLVSTFGDVLLTGLFPARLPWAVIPIATGCFGSALANPAMATLSMALFPKTRGLVSSLQGFFFMALFAVVSGIVAPLLFDSAFKLALGTAIGSSLGVLCWMTAARLSWRESSVAVAA